MQVLDTFKMSEGETLPYGEIADLLKDGFNPVMPFVTETLGNLMIRIEGLNQERHLVASLIGLAEGSEETQDYTNLINQLATTRGESGQAMSLRLVISPEGEYTVNFYEKED